MKINSNEKCSVIFPEHFSPSLVVISASSHAKIKKEPNIPLTVF